MRRRLHSDRVTLIKLDGTVQEGIAANLGSTGVTIEASELQAALEPGDVLVRVIPGGVREEYIVIDPGYGAGGGRFAPSYQATIRRVLSAEQRTAVSPESGSGASVQIGEVHVSGSNARFNMNSTDLSTNEATLESAAIFSELKNLLKNRITDEAESERLHALVVDLEGHVGSPTFIERYRNFVASAADHMTLLAPILVQLSNLIPK